MGRLSEAFKKYWWLWSDTYVYIGHPEDRRKVVSVLKRRLNERGLGDLVRRVDEITKRYDYDVVLNLETANEARVYFESINTVPDVVFELGMIRWRHDKGVSFDIDIRKPTGETIIIPEEQGAPVKKVKLEPDDEMYRKVLRRRQDIEEAMICFMYDVLGGRLLEDWALDIPEGRELWNLIKNECGERLLSEEELRSMRKKYR
ncbi:MAG: hypothetical protein DRN54_03440 [Thaumarchaeota archaeon]|nr:MAG: hypothetical protein DRN54_03440 [Nitrososphaerota archaeon]